MPAREMHMEKCACDRMLVSSQDLEYEHMLRSLRIFQAPGHQAPNLNGWQEVENEVLV